MRKHIFQISAVPLLFCLYGCAQGDSQSNTTDETPQCTPQIPHGEAPLGAPCMEIYDCASGYCAISSHTPSSTDAICEAAPPFGDVHMLANVRDFMTDELMPHSIIKIGGALDIVQNPTGFPVTDTLTANEIGIVDAVLTGDTVTLPLGIIAVIEAEGYYPTSTGLIRPEAGCGVYPAGIRNPDLKMMKRSDLTQLDDLLLSSDASLSPFLPLGDKGGVVGLIRDVHNGQFAEGIVIRSRQSDSKAKIFYMNENTDGFNTKQSGTSGIFVILQPGLAEEFNAYNTAGHQVSRAPATIGETVGILLTTTVQVE